MSRPLAGQWPANYVFTVVERTERIGAPAGKATRRTPALILLHSVHARVWGIETIEPGKVVELGRGSTFGDVTLADTALSRRHATIEMHDGKLVARDHESTNGTFVDGVQLEGERTFTSPRVIRAGRSVIVVVPDLPDRAPPTVENGFVASCGLRRAHQAIARAAGAGTNVLVLGETGSGKEAAARAFHEAARGKAKPFVAVNCASIPAGLAERLLFGTKKGAYSGADANVEGYVQAADGGTLFLDEVGELDPSVQAKLLRTLESGEVLELGATRATSVDIRVVCATHRDLREQVAEQKFRADLFFRLAGQVVRLPPLRERIEEIPWHVDDEFGKHGLVASASFVEACLLRRWPGNVREARQELRACALAVRDDERTEAVADDLPEESLTVPGASKSAYPDDEFARALHAAQGNVSRAADALGVPRGRVRRWLERHGVDANAFKP